MMASAKMSCREAVGVDLVDAYRFRGAIVCLPMNGRDSLCNSDHLPPTIKGAWLKGIPYALYSNLYKAFKPGY